MSSPISPAAQRIARANRLAGLSRILGLAALALLVGFLALFVYQAGVFEALGPKPASLPQVLQDPEEAHAESTTVAGFDREKLPYELAASTARQDKTNPDLVHLEMVKGRFQRAGGDVLTLEAGAAAYNTKLKAIALSQAVRLTSQGQWTAEMDRAHVVLQEKRLTSDSPVVVTLTKGTIRALGVEITDDGKRVLFFNGVKAHFGAASTKGDATP